MTASSRSGGLLRIRPAAADDAAALAEIRNAWSSSDTGGQAEALGLLMDEVDFLDRLSIPHGEDYFCYVAEEDGELLGYVIGGGSRDLDRKAHGEVYEIAVRATSACSGVGPSLLQRAIQNFEEAAFAGTLLSVPTDDAELRDLALGAGMREDLPRPQRVGLVRYERRLPPSSGRALANGNRS